MEKKSNEGNKSFEIFVPFVTFKYVKMSDDTVPTEETDNMIMIMPRDLLEWRWRTWNEWMLSIVDS